MIVDKNRAICLMSSGSTFCHVIYISVTEICYRRTAPTSSSLIARSLKLHLQRATNYHSMSSQTFPI